METSDSEYFESADEDFKSDDEDTKTVKSDTSNEKNNTKDVKELSTKIKKVHITETNVTSINNNENRDRKIENLQKDDENNFDTSDVCKTESVKKEPVKKLGTKFDKNISNVKKLLKEEPDEAEKTQTVVKNDEISNSAIKNEPEIPIKTEVSKSETASAEKIEDDNLWDDSEIDWGKANEEEENMWDNDDWEPVEEIQNPKPQSEESHKEKSQTEPKKEESANTSWGAWGNWGVSSILTTATQSVSTLTHGISTVLESGMGVPEPEELARINKAEKENLKEMSPDKEGDKSTGFGLGNLVMGVSHFTKLVETTSTKVISGGLDTLETIGKKTMEVLQEGDPGLKKKRAFLTIDQEKPVLSQLLREAKEKAEQENKLLEEKHFAKKAKNYETLFDDHQGLVHLEALEMLSKQCDIKLQTMLESATGDSLTEMQETMDQVKELCELPDEDEDDQVSWDEIIDKLNTAVSEINIPISYKKLINTWEETETWLNNLKLEFCDERELVQQAVEALAQLTAIAVEQFHKSGELLLVKEHRSTADEADSLVQLTSSLTSLIGIVAAKFTDKLNAKNSTSKNKEEINGMITNVFFEAANSSSYIQDAFQLLIPVLQVGAV